MLSEESPAPTGTDSDAPADAPSSDSVCPVCGAALISEKCKVICRSERCRYRIIFNCAEF